MKPGFSLLEIVIAILLASMISLVLYTSFEQTKRATRKIESLEEIGILGMIAYHQLESDLAGAFVPSSFLTTSVETSTIHPKQSQKNEEDNSAEVFQATIKGEEKELTFITTNPLTAHQEIKPRLVRVMYRLIPAADKTSFILQRRESTELDLKKFLGNKGAQSFVIMENIKKMSFNFISLDATQKEKKQEFKTWQSEELTTVKKILPDYVHIEGIYEDSIMHKEYEIHFSFFISTASSTFKPEKKKNAQAEIVPPNLLPPPRK